MITKTKNIILIGTIAIAAMISYSSCSNKSIEVNKGFIDDVKSMAELCSVEIYTEVPVRDTINNKELIGIQKQVGSVSFDLENLNIDSSGDTIKIILPPEIVELNESTDENSWEVIDTKGLDLLTSSKLTVEEENELKSKFNKKSIRSFYKDGTIERARAEGVEYLNSLMEKLFKKPVVVTDPTPKGARYNEYI